MLLLLVVSKLIILVLKAFRYSRTYGSIVFDLKDTSTVDDLEDDLIGLLGTLFSCIDTSWPLGPFPMIRFAIRETGVEEDMMCGAAVL
jgi:hypothetical protein